MKKIAIIISNIQLKAGTERAVSNLANLLTKYGDYNVEIVSIESVSTSQPAYELEKKIIVKNLNIPYEKNQIKRIFRHITNRKIISEVIKNEKYDIVIGTEYYINYLLSLLPKTIKRIGCEHFNYDKASIYHKILRRIFYPKLDSIVVLTSNDAKRYSFIKKINCIPNSISFAPNKFATYEKKTFLACGRLTKQKGFDLLIQAAVLIKEKLPDWTIQIYGDGEDKQKLILSIKEKNLDNYIYINEPVKNIEDIYSNSSIYLLSSRFEGLPMVLLESQASGLPGICFNCPEGPSDVIIEGENGCLIPMFDIESFANKSIQIANNKELWMKMTENSKKLSERFSPENIYKKWESLIQTL